MTYIILRGLELKRAHASEFASRNEIWVRPASVSMDSTAGRAVRAGELPSLQGKYSKSIFLNFKPEIADAVLFMNLKKN